MPVRFRPPPGRGTIRRSMRMVKYSELCKMVLCKQFPPLMSRGPVTASALCWAYAASDPAFNWKGFNRLMQEVADFLGVATPYTAITSPGQLSERAKTLICFS